MLFYVNAYDKAIQFYKFNLLLVFLVYFLFPKLNEVKHYDLAIFKKNTLVPSPYPYTKLFPKSKCTNELLLAIPFESILNPSVPIELSLKFYIIYKNKNNITK
jgi:hypothetical protein